MLVLPGQIHHLINLGLRHLIGKHPTYTNPLAMYLKHNLCRFIPPFRKEAFQNMDDEFHGRVVVIEHQHFVHARFFRLRAGLGDDPGTDRVLIMITLGTY